MTAGASFALHPEAAQDILDIWEFVAASNPEAAARVRMEILDGIRGLVSFPNRGIDALTSRTARCASYVSEIT